MKLHYNLNIETKTPSLLFLSNWGEIQYENEIHEYLTTLIFDRKRSFFLDNLNYNCVIVDESPTYGLFLKIDYGYRWS